MRRLIEAYREHKVVAVIHFVWFLFLVWWASWLFPAIAWGQNCTTYTSGGRTYTNCTGSSGTTNCTTYWVGDRKYTNCQ